MSWDECAGQEVDHCRQPYCFKIDTVFPEIKNIHSCFDQNERGVSIHGGHMNKTDFRLRILTKRHVDRAKSSYTKIYHWCVP